MDDEIRKEELWWQYSIELNNPAQEVDESQLNVLEISLRSGVSDSLLSCDNPTRRRRLEGDAGIIGIDYLPRDTVVEGEGGYLLVVFWLLLACLLGDGSNGINF